MKSAYGMMHKEDRADLMKGLRVEEEHRVYYLLISSVFPCMPYG